MAFSSNGPGPIDAFLHWLMQPSATLFSGLAALMIVTFWLGLEHVRDRDEDPVIRFTGGLLAAISAFTLSLGLIAMLRA